MILSQNVELKELTIDKLRIFLKEHSMMYIHNPGGELFQHDNGLLLDIQSINVLVTIYDSLKEKTTQDKFNSIIQNEYKFANLLNKMWEIVK